MKRRARTKTCKVVKEKVRVDRCAVACESMYSFHAGNNDGIAKSRHYKRASHKVRYNGNITKRENRTGHGTERVASENDGVAASSLYHKNLNITLAPLGTVMTVPDGISMYCDPPSVTDSSDDDDIASSSSEAAVAWSSSL
jgi:hypothetical protein